MEDYAFILDYLPTGRPELGPHRREPTCYAVGDNQFTMLELIPKPGVALNIGDRVYIGKDVEKRDKIAKVKGRIEYAKLSAGAHGELPYVLEQMVKANEERFIRFFNEAPPITTRYHALELLPGLGKKTMQGILEERKKSLFAGFAELRERVHNLHAPDKLIAHRIELELSDPHQKYHIFTRPPAPQEPGAYP